VSIDLVGGLCVIVLLCVGSGQACVFSTHVHSHGCAC
jgi:hypothetical protein